MNISPRALLRVEGFIVLVAACTVYAHFDFSWLAFAILFFVPDLSMSGYLVNKKIGATCYNIFHTYSLPLLVLLIAFYTGKMAYAGFVLIWLAHIGFDRALGYGLKYETGFKDTHLQKI